MCESGKPMASSITLEEENPNLLPDNKQLAVKHLVNGAPTEDET